ncbi:MAG TPA: hypothetical protein VEF76_07620 [Patescibacteria group bacterium]|nr:hypothetical protein [Patescibacteria group bacterium]
MYSATGETVLGIAAFQVNFVEPAIIKLKDKLFPPSQKTLDKRLTGYTSVYLFGLKGALKIINDALAKGANPNVQTDRINSEWEKIGTEPLLTKAARHGAQPLVAALVAAGADLDARDSDGKTAFEAARGSRAVKIFLADSGATVTAPDAATTPGTLADKTAKLYFSGKADKSPFTPAGADSAPTPTVPKPPVL